MAVAFAVVLAFGWLLGLLSAGIALWRSAARKTAAAPGSEVRRSRAAHAPVVALTDANGRHVPAGRLVHRVRGARPRLQDLLRPRPRPAAAHQRRLHSRFESRAEPPHGRGPRAIRADGEGRRRHARDPFRPGPSVSPARRDRARDPRAREPAGTSQPQRSAAAPSPVFLGRGLLERGALRPSRDSCSPSCARARRSPMRRSRSSSASTSASRNGKRPSTHTASSKCCAARNRAKSRITTASSRSSRARPAIARSRASTCATPCAANPGALRGTLIRATLGARGAGLRPGDSALRAGLGSRPAFHHRGVAAAARVLSRRRPAAGVRRISRRRRRQGCFVLSRHRLRRDHRQLARLDGARGRRRALRIRAPRARESRQRGRAARAA